jgi:ABC-type lipoprotein release transport system permease subunit
MGLISKISMRNLVRQKRRNTFLGIGIALGMCLLVVTCSFTNGISDTLLNRVVIYMTGHIKVVRMEKAARTINIIRDRERMIKQINQHVEGIDKVWDDVTTSLPIRCLGNGKAANLVIVGVREEDEEDDNNETQILEGDYQALYDEKLPNPIFIFDTTAKDLNVKLNDIVNMKLETINGQMQTARCQVVAIAKAANMFMGTAVLMDIKRLKSLLGYSEAETGAFTIIMKDLDNPALVIQKANLLHAALQPGVAGFKAQILRKTSGQETGPGGQILTPVFALKNGEEDQKLIQQQLALKTGEWSRFFGEEAGALVSAQLAEKLKIKIGDECSFRYRKRMTDEWVNGTVRIAGVYESVDTLNPAMTVMPLTDTTQELKTELLGEEISSPLFVHENVFYKHYFSSLPLDEVSLKPEHALFPALHKEYLLLDRSPTTEASTEKYRELTRKKWKGAIVDVQTMYETASAILQMQGVLDFIGVIAVIVLFFVILVGVVNTLRMSIRERTREIGTNRAIGMQRGDIRAIFVMEILFLTVIACLAGIVFAFILIGLFSLITIDMGDNPLSIILVKKHLYFLATPVMIFINLFVISLIATIIAYFTSRQAANLKVVDALRHYE